MHHCASPAAANFATATKNHDTTLVEAEHSGCTLTIRPEYFIATFRQKRKIRRRREKTKQKHNKQNHEGKLVPAAGIQEMLAAVLSAVPVNRYAWPASANIGSPSSCKHRYSSSWSVTTASVVSSGPMTGVRSRIPMRPRYLVPGIISITSNR